MKDLAFEIIEPDYMNRIKKKYKIYFDGQIEGFGDRCIVINHTFPKIQALKYFAQSINKEYKTLIERCLLSNFFPWETLNNLYEKFKETIDRI